MKNVKRSRLARRLERQSTKTFILSVFGIFVVLFLLMKFGVPILINLSLFMTETKNSIESTPKNSNLYISAPLLNPLPQATNSAQISISGSASKNQVIGLYINDEVVDKTSTEDNGSFVFKDIPLLKGESLIKVKASIDNGQEKKESDFSQIYTVILKNEAPSLAVDSPSDGQSFSKDDNPITVLGKTEAGNKVTVNGFWAIVDESGKFSYNLKLQNGDNEIVINSTDVARNKTEVKRKVTYSP